MQKFINIIKSSVFISLLGLICLAVIVWFSGPLIKFGAENVAPLESAFSRLLIIFIIFAIWAINQFRLLYIQTKLNDTLIDGIQSSDEDEISDSSLSKEELKTLTFKSNQSEE